MSDTASISGTIGIIAGESDLPRLMAERFRDLGQAYHIITFQGIDVPWAAEHPWTEVEFVRAGPLFKSLKAHGCTDLVFVGGMARPPVSLARADLTFLGIAPKLLASLGKGDDQTLRAVLEVFESRGFRIRPAFEVMPELLPSEGVLGQVKPSKRDTSDAARAAEIVGKLGEADVGQAAIVASGVCLGVETIGGTDHMLNALGQLPERLQREGGVLYKAPKLGQDRRIDFPAIGPDTVRNAAAAGLTGVVIEAGGVMVVSRDEAVALADQLGVFLWAREP